MTAESQHSLAEPLLAQLPGRFSPEELDRVRDAYEFAARWHEGQRRKNGTHTSPTRSGLPRPPRRLGLDCTMVCAALLHDVLEDTDCAPGLLRAEFGEEAADLVERLMAFRDGAAVPDDDRVIMLKLLDRLHNMRTIQYIETGKQLSKSQETLELHVPHARRLGLPLVADELQELARHRIELSPGKAAGQRRHCVPFGSARSCCPRRPGSGIWRNGPPSCGHRRTGGAAAGSPGN